jgi:hypothetical protein
MKTFTKLKAFVDDPHYYEKREESLRKLQISTIDAPIVGIIKDFAKLPYCFTLQSCYGHFIHKGQENPKNVEPLSLSDFDKSSSIEYRIAYIALCIQNNDLGKQLLHDLKKITKIDPEYIQFGSADWFWRRQVNSYALQVEPERYKTEDQCRLSVQEALYVEKVRTQVFKELEKMVQMKR